MIIEAQTVTVTVRVSESLLKPSTSPGRAKRLQQSPWLMLAQARLSSFQPPRRCRHRAAAAEGSRAVRFSGPGPAPRPGRLGDLCQAASARRSAAAASGN